MNINPFIGHLYNGNKETISSSGEISSICPLVLSNVVLAIYQN